MSILIDPYMFELKDEEEIKDSISFFMKIIKLSSETPQEQRLSIALYSGMINRIQNQPYQPFPIKIEEISDKDLKTIILQINYSFSNVIIPSIENLDIDECDGDQDFLVDGGTISDELYYDMFSTLLIPCYSKQIMLDERVLTGEKKTGKHIGDVCKLECNCLINEYSKLCKFVSVDDILSPRDRIIDALKNKKNNGEIKVVDTVIADMGDHHNYVRADGKKFETLDELTSKSKAVLYLLKELGLFKIIFARFTSEGVRVIGSFRIHSLEETEDQDILLVKYSAETEKVIDTFLYLPKGVGSLLKEYFQSEQLMYMNVNELIEKIK